MSSIKPNNFKQIIIGTDDEGKLYGSSAPGYYLGMESSTIPGGSIEQNLKYLKDQKIKTIVCLDNSSNKLDDIKKKFTEVFGHNGEYITKIDGISTIIEDFSAPSAEQLYTITQYIINCITKKKQSVLVHCGAGIGRTGTFLTSVVAKIKNIDSFTAINYVRTNYNKCAVETIGQIILLSTLYPIKTPIPVHYMPILIRAITRLCKVLNKNKTFILSSILCCSKEIAIEFKNTLDMLNTFHDKILTSTKINDVEGFDDITKKTINFYNHCIELNIPYKLTEKFALAAQHNIVGAKSDFDERGQNALTFKFGNLFKSRLGGFKTICTIINLLYKGKGEEIPNLK